MKEVLFSFLSLSLSHSSSCVVEEEEDEADDES